MKTRNYDKTVRASPTMIAKNRPGNVGLAEAGDLKVVWRTEGTKFILQGLSLGLDLLSIQYNSTKTFS